MIVDTHCHLAAEEFEKDIEAVLDRAREAGVEKILVVGTDPKSSERSQKLASSNPRLAASAGIHPHDAAAFQGDEAWGSFERLCSQPGFCAVGETGLDFYYNHSPREAQIEMLRRHIALSRKLKRPLILHCRDSYTELAESIDREGGKEAFGVIHCFTGNSEQAKLFLDRGFYISFAGILTFRNADSLRAAAQTIPKDRLLVETDAPFLAPIPHRGKRNEPAFTKITLEKLAEVRGEPFESLAEYTSRNALTLFGW